MYSNLSFKERIECLYSNVKWNNLVLAQVMQLFSGKTVKRLQSKAGKQGRIVHQEFLGPSHLEQRLSLIHI